MPRHNHITTQQAIDNFLFQRLRRNPECQEFIRTTEVPAFITDNLAKDKQLRPYQREALLTFIWLYERNPAMAGQVLFNMATGTGKTLVMACCVLYLYSQGYRNFVFTVARDNIIKQAQKNFTDYKFDKYLFNKDGIKINGKRININVVDNPAGGNPDDINFCFVIINTLYNRLREPHENQLSLDDFKNNKIVVIADEAHHLNVDTKSKKKTDAEEAQNWETVVKQAISANPDNMLLEFTATVELKDENIRTKYHDKLIYRYSFAEFNRDGYSKDVQFLYNDETNIEDQKKLLIVNAVALSEFRRLLAERTMHVDIKPVVLVKSTKIAQSEADREFFDKVIASLRVDDLHWLRDIARQNRDPSKYRQYEIVEDMFRWLANPANGMVRGFNDGGLSEFINQIKMSFAHDNTLIYNSKTKEQPELIMQLDNPRNNIRAIFSVYALNEGWDVLSLYDIIHFDISPSKAVKAGDIQLIGRGARYYPYTLPANYRRDRGNTVSVFSLNRATDKYKRKFDNDPFDTGRALETMVYHFVKTGTFMNNLTKDLKDEGIINNGVETRTIRMKSKFMASDTYVRGFVLQNELIRRKRTTDDEIDTTFNQQITAGRYQLHSARLSDKQENSIESSYLSRTIRLTSQFFNRRIIEKALMCSENNFFRFSNLRQHIPGIKSVDELIDEYLPKYEIQYLYQEGKDIDDLDAREKLRLLVNSILPEIRKRIDLNMPKEIGSNQFTPVPLSEVFEREKTIYLVAYPVDDESGQKVYIAPDERAKAQSSEDNPNLQYDVQNADWYAYDENYGTSEEKLMVKWISGQIPTLRQHYPGCEIYLIRNELDYFIVSPKDGRRFSPDYLLIINDTLNHEMYYQIIIEPKGGHLLLKDGWKEQVLLNLNHLGSDDTEASPTDQDIAKGFMVAEKSPAGQWIRQNGYKLIKPIGLPFYNHEGEQFSEFTAAFRQKLL